MTWLAVNCDMTRIIIANPNNPYNPHTLQKPYKNPAKTYKPYKKPTKTYKFLLSMHVPDTNQTL